jgi:hypothetical protein
VGDEQAVVGVAEAFEQISDGFERQVAGGSRVVTGRSLPGRKRPAIRFRSPTRVAT